LSNFCPVNISGVRDITDTDNSSRNRDFVLFVSEKSSSKLEKSKVTTFSFISLIT
jgi:hypothetical protein